MLSSLQSGRVLVLGDLIFDEFVWGKVRRISPEAPVPVVEVERREYYPGGAANVARNLAEVAASCGMIGRLGEDAAGERMLDLLSEGGIEVPVDLRDSEIPTILKTRVIARQQQVVRVDEERVAPLSAAHRQQVLAYLGENLGAWDALILQDYAKGFFDQALVDELMGLCAGKVLVCVDPNPRNPLSWHGAHTVKPNRAEAFAAAGMEDPDHKPGSSAELLVDAVFLELGRKLLELWECEFVLLTLGELGMLLFSASAPERPTHLAAQASEVFDVSGAGDTAIGFYSLALAAGWEPVRAAKLANAASSRVVEKVGTAVLSMAEIESLLEFV